MRRFLLALTLLFTLSPLSAFAADENAFDILIDDRAMDCQQRGECVSDFLCKCQWKDGATTKDEIISGATNEKACYNSCVAAHTNGTSEFQCKNQCNEMINRPYTPAVSNTANSAPRHEPIIPQLNVQIPGMSNADLQKQITVNEDTGALQINLIGAYLNGVFRFLIGAAVLIMVVLVIIAGFEWMTSRGNKSTVTAAKSRIENAVVGFVLLLGAVTISAVIDPRLQIFKPLSIQRVDIIPFESVVEFGEGIEASATANYRGVRAWQDCMLNTFGASKAEVESRLVTIPCNGSTIQVHEKTATDWKAVCDGLPATGYQINSIGTYNWRANVNNPSVLSFHSWGVAVDINPSTNPNCPKGKTCKYDIPQEVVDLFRKNHFSWGGDWRSLKDYMHFSWNQACGGGR